MALLGREKSLVASFRGRRKEFIYAVVDTETPKVGKLAYKDAGGGEVMSIW